MSLDISAAGFDHAAHRMYRMATVQSFPDVKIKSPLSLEIFKVQTTPWLKPFLRKALDTYKQMNRAVAV